MKRSEKLFLTICIIEVMFLVACGGDSGNGADSDAVAEVKTIHSLGACKGANEGVTMLVTSEDMYYTCSNGVWKTDESSDDETEKERTERTKNDEIQSSSAMSSELGNSSCSSSFEIESGSSINVSSESNAVCEGSEYDASAKTLKDCRDGKVYRTVQIGGQVWMAENLASYSERIKQYSARDLCPSGWHLPNNEEWLTLIDSVGGVRIAGAMLKSISHGGEDKFGFAANSHASDYPDPTYRGGYLGLEGKLALPSNDDFAVVEEFKCSYNDDYSEFESGEIRCLRGDYPGPSAKKLLCDINPQDSSEYDAENNILKDLRDGQSYRTVVIGSRVWMAENLNYVDSKHGKCDNYANCVKYGAFYTAEEYGDPITALWDWSCPKGWHLPDTTIWRRLILDVGGFFVNGRVVGPNSEEPGPAGMALKAKSGWPFGNNGLDSYGFSALPQDYGDRYVDSYSYADFWGKRGFVRIESNNEVRIATYGLDRNDTWNRGKSTKRSVRCVMKK